MGAWRAGDAGSGIRARRRVLKAQERRHLFSLDVRAVEAFAAAPVWWSRCRGAGPGPPVPCAAGRALPWEGRDEEEPGLGVRRAAEGSSGSLCGDAPGAELSGRSEAPPSGTSSNSDLTLARPWLRIKPGHSMSRSLQVSTGSALDQAVVSSPCTQ